MPSYKNARELTVGLKNEDESGRSKKKKRRAVCSGGSMLWVSNTKRIQLSNPNEDQTIMDEEGIG